MNSASIPLSKRRAAILLILGEPRALVLAATTPKTLPHGENESGAAVPALVVYSIHPAAAVVGEDP